MDPTTPPAELPSAFVPAKDLTDDKALARRIRCPRCAAQAHFSCKQHKKGSVQYLARKTPHPERVAAARTARDDGTLK